MFSSLVSRAAAAARVPTYRRFAALNRSVAVSVNSRSTAALFSPRQFKSFSSNSYDEDEDDEPTDPSYATAFVTHPAPEFTADAVMPNGEIKSISLSDYQGKYVVLFSYPLAFTFVCPTEIIEFSDLANEFKKNNCEVIGFSVDSVFASQAWIDQPRNKGGLGKMNIPIASDLTRQMSMEYNVYLQEKGYTMRGTFIIDDKGILRHASMNDPPVGRNVKEILRLVQAYQYTDKHGEVCPTNWTPGSATINPDKKLDYFEKAYKK